MWVLLVVQVLVLVVLVLVRTDKTNEAIPFSHATTPVVERLHFGKLGRAALPSVGTVGTDKLHTSIPYLEQIKQMRRSHFPMRPHLWWSGSTSGSLVGRPYRAWELWERVEHTEGSHVDILPLTNLMIPERGPQHIFFIKQMWRSHFPMRPRLWWSGSTSGNLVGRPYRAWELWERKNYILQYHI